MALSINPISMGIELLAPVAKGLGEKVADGLFGPKHDNGPQMPKDSVHLSNPEDKQDDDDLGKDFGRFLVKLCFGGLESATSQK